jgi:The  BURPS668_1122 family of deaminases
VEFRIVTEESIRTSNYLSEAILNEFLHKTNTVRYRTQDTEYKLLENRTKEILEYIFAGLDPDNLSRIKNAIEVKDLDGILEFTKEISGNLTLFTERRACESCASVMALFQKLFPNINFRILEGFGDFVFYGPDGIMYPRTQGGIADLRYEVAFDLAEHPDQVPTPANTFVPIHTPVTV